MRDISYEMASGLYRPNSNGKDSVLAAVVMIAVSVGLLFVF